MSRTDNAVRDHMIVAKFLAGRSCKEIGEWAGVHSTRVSQILKRNNMTTQRRAELRAAAEKLDLENSGKRAALSTPMQILR